jgi:hypothetical protein
LSPHALPHAPQFAASVVTSMHAPMQQPCPSAQRPPVDPQTHMPPSQRSPVAQAFPIAPQLFTSVDVLMHV